MKIDPSKLVSSPYLRPAKGPKDAAPGAETRETTASLPQDTVEVSSLAEELGRLQTEVSELPDTRLDRVRELRERIARGEYVVDSKGVAERLLEQAAGIAQRADHPERKESS